ncbi:MAG TPA: hypothetical protein VIX90_07180 [Edaphobacter sp.]
MRAKSLSFVTALALSSVLVMSGCKSSPPASDATTQQPASQPATEPAAAPSVSPAASPAATPAPTPAATPAPAPVAQAAPAPMPAEAVAPAPPPPPKKLTAPTGTAISVTITQQLSAKNNNVGDGFTGELAAPVKTSGGATVFPRGAHVVGTVVADKGRGKFKGSGALGIQLTEISGYPVSADSYEKEEKGKGKRTAGMVGGGAGGGALIGGLAGGGKGALIGGLIGAGAGTAGAAFTGNKDVVIPAESVVTFHLTAPVTVTVKPKE